ncbi:MAG: serine/threonine-protein kinase [Lactobacillales bacterium]|jgi:serine/threonine protein kinase|nr:serine/threonine-protein kinase [Lactobacillales bacterium]
MANFSKKATGTTKDGTRFEVIEQLGSGGQGIVYKVKINCTEKALKWYNAKQSEDKGLHERIEKMCLEDAPSDKFVWPLEFVDRDSDGQFGYIMDIFPSDFESFSKYLNGRVSPKSYEALTKMAINLAEAFDALHSKGYSYQDLNDGNIVLNMTTGDILLCDNDNVVANQEQSGILGKARYLAPEMVTGTKKYPDKQTDRYSLSVLLFMLFTKSHPLEGERVLKAPCLTEAASKKLYGSDALFIFDPKDDSNRPNKRIHRGVISAWPELPKYIQDRFIEAFSQELLSGKKNRISSDSWKKDFNKMLNSIYNGDKFFDPSDLKVVKHYIDIDNGLTIIPLIKGKTVKAIDINEKGDEVYGVVLEKNGRFGLGNKSKEIWQATLGGKQKIIKPKEVLPIQTGVVLKIKSIKLEFK